MQLAYYAGVSTAAAAACLVKAFHQRPNFYSATVYLSQSNACLLILTNLVLVLACSFMFGLQRLLYGRLRPIEMEQLSEKAWYAVLDTLLAMPSFREDVGGWLLTMFVLLLAGKVWGWIGEGRVDILEQQPPANPRLFHTRLATSLVVSVLFDLYMLNFCIDTVMADPRPGMMVIFTFEFAILSIFSLFTLSRYCLVVWETMVQKQQLAQAIESRKIEIRAERVAARQQETADGRPAPALPPDEEPIEVDENEVDVPGWEEKRRYLFALEVFSDFVKLLIYIFFFAVSITFNGLPMHIMRDVYMTFASFSKRVTDYVAYRKATSSMNTRYPDATTEEIRGDACIVCRENMVAWEPAHVPGQPAPAVPAARRDEGLRAKKLPCGHILHLRCLKAWLERQQVCPTCRRPVVAVEAAAAAGQPGGPAANPPPGGQHPQHRPPRQNRARIFNLGPLRVGFLNGPGDQIQNIVNQMRNPAAAAQGPVPGGDRQGVNNIAVPALDQPAGQQAATVPHGGVRAQVPTSIQLMQIEQRIVQEIYNLNVEQQQLAVLRLMETELARLRAQQIPLQPSVGTATAIQRQMGSSLPNPTLSQETLHGTQDQQIGNGQEGLPPGLTLPDGWTMMPLQRTNGSTPIAVDVQTQHPTSSLNLANMHIPELTPTVLSHNGVPSDSAGSGEARGPSDDGPTDDAGSPLFVPTATSAAASSNGANPADSTTAIATTSGDTVPDSVSAPAPAPWSTSEDWGFSKANNHRASSSSTDTATTLTDSTSPEQQAKETAASTSAPADQSYEGKGKGKAVEVEDVPDPDS